MGARRLLPTSRRGRARGVTGLPEPAGGGGAGGEVRVLETWGGGMVGLAGAGRLVLRAVSSAGAAASEGFLLTLGEAGLGGASDSILSLAATEAEVGAGPGAGAGAGVAAGVGMAIGSSSEAGLSLSLSWAAGAENRPDTLKLMSPGNRVSALWIRASTTPTTWMDDTEAASS